MLKLREKFWVEFFLHGKKNFSFAQILGSKLRNFSNESNFSEIADVTIYDDGYVSKYTWLYFTDECQTREPRINHWLATVMEDPYIVIDLQDWSKIKQISVKNADNTIYDNA